MTDVQHFVGKFLRDRRGATAIEYGLIVALIAIGLITSFTTLRGAISTKFNSTGTAIRNAS